ALTWTKVQIRKVKRQKDREQLTPGNLEHLLYNNKLFLQQLQDDSNPVYFPVNGVGDNKSLNTFLITIPLTKFLRPLTEFQAQSQPPPTEEPTPHQPQPHPQATQI
ncbi:hemagglutinin, partial [Mycoplasmopsis synoviae]